MTGTRRQKWIRQNWAIQREAERMASGVYGLTTDEGYPCQYINPDGIACKSAALKGGTFCRQHAPKAK